MMTQVGPSSGGVIGPGTGNGGSSSGTDSSTGGSSGGVNASGSSGSSGGVIASGSSGSSGGVVAGASSSSSSGATRSMDDAGESGEGGGPDGGSGSGVATSVDGGAGCPPAAAFCDGFESGSMLGPAWTVDNNVAANTVTVVSTKAHSGSNSVHFTFDGAVGVTFIDEKLGVPATGAVWGRVWMYPNTETDNGTGPDPHVIYIEAEPAGFTGHSATGVRPLNTISGKVVINVAPPDNGPSANIALPEGAWHCFEWEISGIGGNGGVALYMDGTLLANDMGTAIATIGEMRVGCERYNAGTMTGDLYLDDYAIGPTRLGCN
jgi:hypothetical protein